MTSIQKPISECKVQKTNDLLHCMPIYKGKKEILNIAFIEITIYLCKSNKQKLKTQ